jgi:hypothetical protein
MLLLSIQQPKMTAKRFFVGSRAPTGILRIDKTRSDEKPTVPRTTSPMARTVFVQSFPFRTEVPFSGGFMGNRGFIFHGSRPQPETNRNLSLPDGVIQRRPAQVRERGSPWQGSA